MSWVRLQPLLPLFGAVAIFVVLAALLLAREASERDLANRVASVRSGAAARPGNRRRFATVLANAVRSLGISLRQRTLKPREVQELEGMLTAAGYNAARALPVLVVAKVACLIVAPALAWLVTSTLEIGQTEQDAITGMGLILGVMLPNAILRLLRRPYVKSLRRGLPDALDLLVVCANAGLGLESAVDRVAKEMHRANRATGLQFELLSYEMRVMPDRREALQNLGERTGLESYRRLAATLMQALRYGTPLSQALRALAQDMRQERLVHFEERTARLPALMVMPMVGFILPVLFIVLAGPAIQQLLEALKGFH